MQRQQQEHNQTCISIACSAKEWGGGGVGEQKRGVDGWWRWQGKSPDCCCVAVDLVEDRNTNYDICKHTTSTLCYAWYAFAQCG